MQQGLDTLQYPPWSLADERRQNGIPYKAVCSPGTHSLQGKTGVISEKLIRSNTTLGSGGAYLFITTVCSTTSVSQREDASS